MITINTATDIALAHREIETANKLLADVEGEIRNYSGNSDVRDNFGRRVNGLELAVPSSGNSKRLFCLDWKLAKPVIEAHIAKVKCELSILNEKAIIEAQENGNS